MSRRRIKYIIFDLGGVLIQIHPEKFRQRISHFALKPFNGIDTVQNQLQLGWIPAKSILKTLKQKYKINLSLTQLQYYFKHDYIGKKIKKMEGLIKKHLLKKYQIVLLSNTNDIHFKFSQLRLPFLKYFNKLYVSYRLHCVKPNNKIFSYVIEDLKAQPEEILLIDDTEENIIAAHLLKINTIKVKTNQPKIKKIIAFLKNNENNDR